VRECLRRASLVLAIEWSVMDSRSPRRQPAIRPRTRRFERAGTIPAARFGTPEEFGAFAAFLCSAQAGYLTGQNIVLDGGAYPGLI
jgi:NAD(P)-dependent dehydrogenase (short-subunit alcohol dehydrogenase family)